MRNVKLLHSVHIADTVELSNAEHMCIDYDSKLVYSATVSHLYALDTSKQEVVHSISLADHGYLPTDGSSVLVGMEYLPNDVALCLATSRGDVILWRPTSDQPELELECVGSVEQGLTAMSWSSDLEIVILATGNDTLIMMTRDFDPVTEVPIFSEEFGEAAFVNVGWGKKETQFHGSEGKEAAKMKKPETVKPVFDWDDRRPRICWHGDGEYFVVSAVHPASGSRRLRVWTRDCALHSTSELVDGLEQALSWRSTGNLITCSQRLPNKHDIVFFERNGLRHGEFTLPFRVGSVNVIEIHWNRDSNIVAIWLEDKIDKEIPSSSPNSYVQLWTVSNYHWYLKQSLRFGKSDGVATLCWDQEYANCLHVLCRGGQYAQYTWAFSTDSQQNLLEQSLANVAVIDGAQVLLTPFKHMVVPPPMSAYSLQLSSPVNQVIQAPPTLPNDLAFITADNDIIFFTYNSDETHCNDVSIKPCAAGGTNRNDVSIKPCAAGGAGFSLMCLMPSCRGIYSLSGDSLRGSQPLKYYHIMWHRTDAMLMCSVNAMGTESELYQAHIDHQSKTVTLGKPCEVGGHIYQMAVCQTSGNVVVERLDGAVLKYDHDSHSVSPWMTPSGEQVKYVAPKLCSQLNVCEIGGEEVVLGLNDHYQFYVNNTMVTTNCTSFFVHDEFLLLTTYAHTCRCINRSVNIDVLATLADDKAHPYDESVRRVERGSRLVIAVAGETKVVLQMPRGNLETIHPRALVLCAVRKHLNRLEFSKAFTVMRKHRINMNLLHDHNPTNFLENIEIFIRQIESPAFINQFLTDLQEEDVTRTMYTAAYKQSVNKTLIDTNKPSKIDTICDALRRGLELINSDKYLLSILTAYVKKSTPELDIALKTVKALKEFNKNKVSAEEALKYLLFLVDVNELYDVALGTYDFDLVILVAEKSQKDPKEYIPFLNSLRAMEPNYQHYVIDKHLKRYVTALGNIVNCGPEYFDECMKLVQEHRLYREALALYEVQTTQYKEIAAAYGDFLMEKKHESEAGLMYSKAESWHKAVNAYETCSDWQMALCMAYRADFDDQAHGALCRRLVSRLRNNNRFSEAACILHGHLDDLEEAIVMLIDGAQWQEALRLIYKSGRTDLIETNLQQALVQSCNQFISLLETVHSQFEKHTARLLLVREQKEKARIEFLEGGEHNRADADLFSDTSSMTGDSVISGSQHSTTNSNQSTIFSKRTGQSSKTRRKAERKKWSLKEGSAYEDIALVDALSQTCRQTEEWRGDIGSLIRALSLFHHEAATQNLQAVFDKLLRLVERSIPVIWPEEVDDSIFDATAIGPNTTANAIAQAMQRGGMRSEIKIDPALRVPPVITKDNKWKLHSSLSSTQNICE